MGGGPILCFVLTKTDFQNLPHYKRRYHQGEQVICIPTGSETNNPVQAIVVNPLQNDYHNVIAWTADGEVEADVAYTRPDIAAVQLEWRKMLQADATQQAPGYAVAYFAVAIVEDIALSAEPIAL